MMRLNLYRLWIRFPVFKGKARLDGWIKDKLFPKPVFALPSGIRMALDPIEWAQRAILSDGHAEPLTTALMRSLLGPGDVYVDVGCHVGYHTLVARSAIGSDGRVVAIDPQPYNGERTMENWRLNGFTNLVLYVAAAGSSDDMVTLAQQPTTDHTRLSLLDSDVGQSRPRFSVPVHRLETIMLREAISRVRLLKIDTEGYELQVLIGAGSFLSGIDNIILELLPEQMGGAEELLRLLTQEHAMQLATVEGHPWRPGDGLPEHNLWASRKA